MLKYLIDSLEVTILENDTSKLFTIPNLLTFIRMLLIPVFLICYYQMPEKPYVAMLVFAVASLTDAFDGYLARRLNQISSFGKLCDPLADKLMVLSMLFCLGDDKLLAPPSMPWLNKTIIIVVLVKEALMVAGGLFLLKKGHVVYSNMLGKIATTLFCVALIMVFPWHGIAFITAIGQYLMLAAVVMTLVAFCSYLLNSVKLLKRS